MDSIVNFGNTLNKPVFGEVELSDEQVQELKSFVFSTYSSGLYRSYVDEKPIYWRGMTGQEFDKLLDQGRMSGQSVEQLEKSIVQKIIMHPTVGIGPGMINIEADVAGLKQRIMDDFNLRMGFTMVQPPVKL